MGLELEALTGDVIGAAIEVHRELGPGFLESIYENALAIELRSRRILLRRQTAIPVLSRGFEVGRHRPDFLVNTRLLSSSRPRNTSRTSTSWSSGPT